MIRVFEPTYNEAAARAVTKEIEAGWISHGEHIEKFEEEFAQFVGAKHCIAVSSCSAALELCMAFCSAGNYAGTTITVPRVTFASVLNAAVRWGKVRMVDEVYVNTNCPIRLSRQGMARMDYIIYDCAHTCEAGGYAKLHEPAAACYSFYPTKVLSGLEGGAICTNDDEAARRLRILSRNGLNRQGSDWNYQHLLTGFKMAMTNIQAVYLREQLKHIGIVNWARWQQFHKYHQALPSWGSVGNYTFTMKCEDVGHRDRVIEELRKRGIETTVQFLPLDRKQSDWADMSVQLPLHMQIEDEQQDYVIECAKALV